MLYPVLLVLFGFFTRLAYFGWPPQVVFDEVYFATFVGDYSRGMYFFDIHPPLAKLMAKFFGDFVGASYDMDMTAIGNGLPFEVILLRLLPIFAGIFLPVIVYYICRELKFSSLMAFGAGLLVVLENSLIVQSRFILLDSIMLFFGFGAILLYLLYVKKKRSSLLVLSAVACACAFSIKWTGLAYPLLLFISEVYRTKRLKEIVKWLSLYIVVGFFVYFSMFAIHFAFLYQSGSGDNFMTDRFQKTLIGNPYENDPQVKPRGFFGKTFELNYKMYDANHTLTESHPYSSLWYTWPLMLRPIFYWQGAGTEEFNQYIYLLGNPLIYWFGTLSILGLLWKIILRKLRDPIALFIVVGFLVNYLPYIFIGRAMFIYHYEAALVFSIFAIFYYIQTFFPPERHKRTAYFVLGICFVSFIFFAPLTYGLDLSYLGLYSRMWLPTWR
jgi:dolichyl-phosphate-mannose-protein mannosyltransferase